MTGGPSEQEESLSEGEWAMKHRRLPAFKLKEDPAEASMVLEKKLPIRDVPESPSYPHHAQPGHKHNSGFHSPAAGPSRDSAPSI